MASNLPAGTISASQTRPPFSHGNVHSQLEGETRLRTALVQVTSTCTFDRLRGYAFNPASQTLRSLPPRMRLEIALQVLQRICDFHPPGATDAFRIMLQGGEAMLWPEASYTVFLQEIERRRRLGWKLDITVQTNLVVAPSAALLDVFLEQQVALAVCLHGPADDDPRLPPGDFGKRGTQERAMRNLRHLRLQGYGGLIRNFVLVAKPQTCPREFLAWAGSLPSARMDIIWEARPGYGRWFSALFDAWWEQADARTEMEPFSHLVTLEQKGQPRGHAVFQGSNPALVINTDGCYEYPDAFQSVAPPHLQTPFNVRTHGIDSLTADPLFAWQPRAATQACDAGEAIQCAEKLAFLEHVRQTLQRSNHPAALHANATLPCHES